MALIADGALALAAIAAALRVSQRPGCARTPRALAALLSAFAAAGLAHALAAVSPGVSAGAVAAVLALAAAVAWVATAALWRGESEPAVKKDATTELLDIALAACNDGVMIAAIEPSESLQIVYSNPTFEQLTGYTHDEAVGMSPSMLVDEADCLAAVRSALRGTQPVRVEVPGRRKDGSRVWAEWQVVPVTSTDGEHTHSIAVLRDTTQRRRAEQALRESEARFRGLFEHAADGIFILDSRGKIVDANRKACQSLGYARKELTDLTMAQLNASPPAEVAGADENSTVERTFRRKDGGTLEVEIRFAQCESGGVRLNLAIVRDVTPRRLAAQALREREQLLRSIIAHIPCGVFWKDRYSVYLGCNEQVALDHGLESSDQVVGRSDYDINNDADEATFYRDCDRSVIESGQPLLNFEEPHKRLDGSRATLLTSKVPLRDARGEVVGVLGVYTDITDRKRLEEQLRQAQKMEAVGQLAGGVAHDFNNLLTIIRGNAELLRSPQEAPATRALFDDLILAADRATALVRQLLMFSRRQPTRVEALDLNEVATSLSSLLRRVLGERVVLAAELADGPLPLRADRSCLEQVVMNLAVNARDAMPDGGTLTIRTEVGERTAGGRTVRFARLAISDTGVGMTEAVKARIFEPFFTTKGQDKGTGLGLATVFGIVQQAGGHIEVDSAPGAGSTFRVDLPWWEGGPSGAVPAPPPRTPAATRPSSPLAVLVVEDQEAVRKFARKALETQGHKVTEAENGAEALQIVHAGAEFDVLISDVTMPGIDGRELAARIRALRPQVGVVIMSGYVPDSDSVEPVEGSVFLQKPFPPGELLAALNKALPPHRRKRVRDGKRKRGGGHRQRGSACPPEPALLVFEE